MRNLTVLNRGTITPESRTYPDLHIIDSVFDVVSDSITFVLSSEEAMTIEIQQFMKNGETKVLASFPVSSPLSDKSQLLSFNHFVDTCQLVLVFQNGDIITATYDPAQPDFDFTVVEIVGSIDVGLSAASWSHDEETLAILTNENKLLLLSRLFEPIVEKELDSKDIHISDSKHVSVGWGKKETQFKGRGFKALEREKEALKHAGLNVDNETQLRDPTVNELERGTLSPFDTHANSISWRGDCEYFVVSTIESVVVEDTAEMYDRRVFRVFNREGVLDSVNEAVDGLEHCLAWKPQGALIASTQRHIDEDGDEVLDVVFYERNGLRHGQFNSRLNPELDTIQQLSWSSDSEVLMFQLHDRIQLWTTKNYHWYLKQEIHINLADYANNKILFSKFHPEKPLHLMIATSETGIEVFDLAYKTVNGSCILGNDLGMTLVVDGNIAKITPLSIANVPPPISFREIEIEENISDLAVSLSNEKYAILTSKNVIYTSQLSIENMKKGQHPAVMGRIDVTKYITETDPIACQVAFIGNSFLAVAIDCSFLSRVLLFDVEDVANPSFNDCVEISPKVVLLKSQADYEAIVAQTLDSRIIQINNQMDVIEIGKFPQLCRDFEVTCTDVENKVFTSFGISSNGKLFANEHEVASGVTSLKITEAHLLFTTVQSQLCFAHLTSSHGDYKYQVLQDLHNETLADERIRMIERGSILINVMPSKYTVVLEAPRGNLESICPRIMVLSGVRKFIKQKQYKKAFLSCRTHRIDLDIIHDYAPELFLENVEHFINEIEKVEYLDLFVSCLSEQDVAQTKYRETKNQVDGLSTDVSNLSLNNKAQQSNNTAKRIIKNSDNEKFSPDSKVNKICNALLSVLQTPPYFEKYLQTIITAFACQKPPNLTEALSLIGNFKDEEQREQAVTHLCFLQDVNKLFDNALGLYDVKLALLIAQHSQKDPKEYLPFLQNLHIQPQLRKQFLIDDHLKKYEKALTWLFELGAECNEEFDEYVVKHDLYKPAMTIYKYDDKRYNTILSLYANSLQTQQKFDMAALAYEYLGDHENALVNYIHCKRWNEALAIAEISESKEKVIEVAENLISLLTQDHRYAEAAEIERHFMNNIEAAITLYCKNYHYDQAILLAVSEKKSELLESVVDVQMGEGFGTIAELLADCKSQMNSQLRRIRELRAKKQEDPYSFYGQPNEDLDTPDNVSVAASETSTTPSFFTRYTGKTSGTAKTGASRRTAKNRKREERKRAKGRKGTIYEEEYLINSVGRLLERLDQTQPDAIRLIEGLIRRHRKEQAVQIQKNWCQLLDFIKENIVEIHDMSEKDRERFDDNGNVYLIPEIPVPVIKDFPKKDILDY